MHASADRLEFAPPPQPGLVRAFVLAVIAHLLLMLALTWGINWNRQTENVVAEAELWSAVPQVAAPPVVQPPPPPPPTPELKAEPAPPPPVDPNIALEREKKLEARKKAEDRKRELLAEKKAAEDRKKQEEQAKAAKTKKQQLEEDKRLAASRAAQMDRIRAMAGATGRPDSPGTAVRSSGPSADYAAKIAARIKPHIRHPQEVPGNPPVVIEVRTSPDGTIVGQRVVKSSGIPAWDESAIRAIIATGSLPRNEEGRVPSPMEISVRQRDQ
jgi:colicin import membrane protein